MVWNGYSPHGWKVACFDWLWLFCGVQVCSQLHAYGHCNQFFPHIEVVAVTVPPTLTLCSQVLGWRRFAKGKHKTRLQTVLVSIPTVVHMTWAKSPKNAPHVSLVSSLWQVTRPVTGFFGVEMPPIFGSFSSFRKQFHHLPRKDWDWKVSDCHAQIIHSNCLFWRLWFCSLNAHTHD